MVDGRRTVRIDEEVPVYLVRKEVLEATPNGCSVPAQRFTLAPTTGHYYRGTTTATAFMCCSSTWT